MKALLIAQKNLLEIFRNLKHNAILFVMPMAFIGIFGLAFGNNIDNITFAIGYVKDDNETFVQYIDGLMKLQNGEVDVFKIKEFDELNIAKESFRSNGLVAIIEWDDELENIKIYGNPQSSFFGAVNGIVNSYTGSFFDLPEEKLNIKDIGLTKDASLSPFDLLVPGLIVYAILLLIIQTATNLSQVKSTNQIFRYFTSKTTSLDIIFGYLLSMIVIALIQSLILYSTAYAFGFRAEANLHFAFLISMILVLFSVGVGLFIGAFATKPESASNTGTLVSLILGFFSGSFIVGIENVIKWGNLSLTDLVPSFYAVEALKGILLYGDSVSDVKFEIGVLVVSSTVILALGIYIYDLKQLRNLS